MPIEPEIPSSNKQESPISTPPQLRAAEPPVLAGNAPSASTFPPAMPGSAEGKAQSLRRPLAVLLSLCLGLFLADSVVSLLDDSLILLFGVHVLTWVRGIVFLLALLLAIVSYLFMGLTPMIPKRVFLPLTLFNLAAGLLMLPCMIYFSGRLQQVSWGMSVSQVVFGLSILYWAQRGLKFGWPLVPEARLKGLRFSWSNLTAFLLANILVLLPAVLIYLAVSAALAVGHFSEGFLALRPGGFTVQVRKYVRDDGKAIQLVPMAHIGESDFYSKLQQSFPSDATILMEGVTDSQNLLTNRLSYKHTAESLGLAAQEKEFHPSLSDVVWADVDVADFTTNTIGFLNLAMLLHSQGLKVETLLKLMQFTPPPGFEAELLEDLVGKRNRRLVETLNERLPGAQNIIVPWGVAHMPGVAREIQKIGFRLDDRREYQVIRFHSVRAKSQKGDQRPQ